MKHRIILIVLMVIVLNTFLVNAEVKEYYQNSNHMKVYAPEKLNVFEPYKIKAVFSNPEMTEGYDLIGVSGSCSIAFKHLIGLEEPSLELHDYSHYKYNGEKEVELLLNHMKTSGTVDVFGVIDDDKKRVVFYDCSIMLKNSSDLQDYSSKVRVNFRPDFYPYSIGIENLPSGFHPLENDVNSKEEILKSLYRNYEKSSDNQKIRLLMKAEGIGDGKGGIIQADDFLNHIGSLQIGKNYEEIEVGREKGHMYYSCSESKGPKFFASCNYDGFVLKPFGIVRFDMKASVMESFETYEEKSMMEDNWKQIFIDAMKNAYFESDGKTAEIEFEESDDDYCGDCKMGYVCGACGKCIKETKAIDPSKIDISTDFKIKNDDKKILNSITSNLALTVFPNAEFNYDGKKVDYCNLKEPGVKMEIKGELLGNDTYSGFTSGFPSDEREESHSCDINFRDSKPDCVFIVSPSSRKKFFADAKNVVDEYVFSTEINGKIHKEKARLTMIPPKDFELELRSKNKQIQQGNNGVLEITASGGTTPSIIIKTTLLGPGKIGKTSDTINTNWILQTIKTRERTKIGYSAPAMGNFDIGKELESLSMTKLQSDAAKQIALDAVTAYGGDYAGDIEKLVDAGEYSSKIGHLTDTYKAINGVRNIKGVDKSVQDMNVELGDAMQVNDGKDETTWAENAADVGIIGISAAQTAVGVLTFIPNKIPGVNKLSAGVQTAFSAATNIWKANLQYISKSEKIERAKELYYPTVIVVTAQDISGWTTQDMHIFQIAYHQID